MYIRNPSTTSGAIRLVRSPALERAQRTLQDLITDAYQRSTNRPGRSLSLVRFQFAYEESSEGKYCTHYDVLVKAPDLNENIPLTVSIAVNNPQENWT